MPHREVVALKSRESICGSEIPSEVPQDMPVRFVDVGCGFGGLLTRLAPLYPDRGMLGFELRDKVWQSLDFCMYDLSAAQPRSPSVLCDLMRPVTSSH